jgi:hypothetical protein
VEQAAARIVVLMERASASETAVEWVVAESESATLVEALGDADIEVVEAQPWTPPAELLDEYPDAQFEPFTLVAAVVATGWLIRRISDVLLDWKRPGGMLFDTRNSEKLIAREVPLAPRGSTIIIGKDGDAAVYEPDRRDDALSALTQMLGGAGAG